MKEIIVSKNEDGITLKKYLKRLFSDMPDSLLHKLLRKNYFELNKNKAEGNEVLNAGDSLAIFLSQETFDKFYNRVAKNDEIVKEDEVTSYIVYEDENLIVFNKPVGMPSQNDKSGEKSVNSLLENYTRKDDDTIFKPSIVNRLDRNTEGLMLFAKTYITAREISKMIKENMVEKRYKAVLNGVLEDDAGELIDIYKKDEKSNKAIIKEYNGNIPKGYSLIKLKYKTLKRNKNNTIVDVDLITGKSHQIRAQFANIGHPIVCDKKYMSRELYEKNVKEFGVKTQKLICYKIKFGNFTEERLKYLSNRQFEI